LKDILDNAEILTMTCLSLTNTEMLNYQTIVQYFSWLPSFTLNWTYLAIKGQREGMGGGFSFKLIHLRVHFTWIRKSYLWTSPITPKTFQTGLWSVLFIFANMWENITNNYQMLKGYLLKCNRFFFFFFFLLGGGGKKTEIIS